MVERTELEKYLRDLLSTPDFEDYCLNGLQLEGKTSIQKIAFGVSFNELFLQKSLEWSADAMIVHHGIFGKNFFSVVSPMKQKIKVMLDADVSLFGYHLPLDAHPFYGNNAQIIKALGANITESFEVGYFADFQTPVILDELINRLHQTLNPDYRGSELHPASLLQPKEKYGFRYYDFGPEAISRIAVISGGASRHFEDAAKKGAEAFICGEIQEYTGALAYDYRKHFLNIGHYWSEKTGIQALLQHLESHFDIQTLFIDIENSI